MGPPRKIRKKMTCFVFFWPTQKMSPDGPKWGQEDFLPTHLDPADILGDANVDFKFLFFDFLGPTFLAWAQLGPTHLGPAWAHPLGPSLGPPTWARLGPSLGPPTTHLGPAWAHLLGPGWGPPTQAVNLENSARLEFHRRANRTWQATSNATCHM